MIEYILTQIDGRISRIERLTKIYDKHGMRAHVERMAERIGKLNKLRNTVIAAVNEGLIS